MSKNFKLTVLGGFVVSGLAVACAMMPMPPVGPIKVSALDIAIAAVQGYENPARAAALKKLDSKASAIVGESNWKNNNYIGPVTYMIGDEIGVIVTEDKPCDKKAVDSVSKSGGTSSSGGSYGGYYWTGGKVYGSSGDCLYGCGTVKVGDLKEA